MDRTSPEKNPVPLRHVDRLLQDFGDLLFSCYLGLFPLHWTGFREITDRTVKEAFSGANSPSVRKYMRLDVDYSI